MPSLAAIRASNAAFVPAYAPVAIFVGGTSGLGQGIAEAFARHVKGNAHIVIIGRNRAAADSILSQLPKPTVAGITHEFVQCDVTKMKNIQSVTKELLTRIPKINFLVMTPGIMTTKGREETDEGIDRKMAIHYYARWKFTNDLMPALLKAKADGEDAKVMSVFAAGKGGEIDLDDIGLKKTYSLSTVALQTPTYNDLALEEFAVRNPGINFSHAYPGAVRTGLLSSSETPLLRAASYIIPALTYPFTTSQVDAGEYLLHGMLNTSKGAFSRIGSRGEDIGMSRYFGSEEARRRLWEHTVKATQVSS
ncbi:hypothetical protein BDZ94DRAFT_1264643 [Collybia nuda]|uniref:NAD(P)-binding protein n=1 Tax=Collybia nuda TaxID=64659 RepID=A0A9P5Y2B0_9AGAR|nr:hypothetical protein BDZ94DRAFT_1264643 [Collybia nuda]